MITHVYSFHSTNCSISFYAELLSSFFSVSLYFTSIPICNRHISPPFFGHSNFPISFMSTVIYNKYYTFLLSSILVLTMPFPVPLLMFSLLILSEFHFS